METYGLSDVAVAGVLWVVAWWDIMRRGHLRYLWTFRLYTATAIVFAVVRFVQWLWPQG